MGITPQSLRKIVKSEFSFDTNPDGSPRGNALGRSWGRDKEAPMVQAMPDDFNPKKWRGDTRIDQITDSGGKVHDVTRYLTPRTYTSTNFLSPLKRGRGWRHTNRLAEDESNYDEWESQTLEELFDTISHEDTHDATQKLISSAARNSGMFQPKDDIRDSYDYRNPKGKQYDQETIAMLHLLDNERKQRLALSSPRAGDESPRFVMPRTDRSAYDEMAAYTGEYPQNPGYAMGRWLMHDHVEQENRRKALQSIAAAQKKWGMDPINAKAMLRHLNPKNRWVLTDETREIMGPNPARRPPGKGDGSWQPTPEVSAQRLLYPPEERIYRNLRNAILGQSGSVMANSGMFATDPGGYMNRDSRYADRLMGAKSLGGEALSALDKYFKGVQRGDVSSPRSISDLPEGLRGEIGRLELRRILANQVADQYRLVGDNDWENPDFALASGWRPSMMLDHNFSANLANADPSQFAGLGNTETGYHDNPYIPNPKNYRDMLSPDEVERYAELFELFNEKQKEYYNKSRNDWSQKWDYRNDLKDEESYDNNWNYGKLYREARDKDELEHDIWTRPDLHDSHPPGPNVLAALQQIADEKAAMQAEINERAESLGITDYESFNRPKMYPEQMLDDMEFVEFDANNPEHAKALEYWNKQAQDNYSSDFSERVGRGKNFAQNIFPSLYYGLIPKEALQFYSQGTHPRYPNERGDMYGIPETERTYLQGRYSDPEDKPKTVGVRNYQGLVQDPFRGERSGWGANEDDEFPEVKMIPHPLAGKPIMQYTTSGLANPKNWELMSDPNKTFKTNRMKNYGENPYYGPKVGMKTFSDIDRVSLINDIAEMEGITPEQAKMKYMMGGWDDEYNTYDTRADKGLYFRRKGNKGEREAPRKLEPKEKWEYDPVTRAIAQAFMEHDMDRIVDEDESEWDSMRWADQDIGQGNFGSEPFGSEYKDVQPSGWGHRDAVGYDKLQKPWDISTYMQQLLNPMPKRGEKGYGDKDKKRKTLNEILGEIVERRQDEFDNRELEEEEI